MFRKLLDWFGKPKKVKVRVVVIRRDICRMTVTEWRSNKEHVSMAQRVLAGADVRALLDVVRNSSPVNEVTTQADNLPLLAVQKARIEGYHMALNNLECLGVLEEIKPELVSEFANPDATIEEEQG